MKKMILKIFLPVFSIILLFSSCLGDSETTFEQSRSFSYIGTYDGVQYAATASGYKITSDVIKGQLTAGQCYYLSFKLGSGSASSNGIYNADMSGTPELIKASAFSLSAPPTTPPANSDSLYVNVFNVGNRSPVDYYGDRWHFAYTWQKRGDETSVAQFFYDKTNQIDADGTEINTSTSSERENKAIIDVYLTKTNLDENGVAQSDTKETVANLSTFKATFNANPDSEKDIVTDGSTKYVRVAIKFRYWAINATTKLKEQKYLGSWSVSESNTTNSYYILIKQ